MVEKGKEKWRGGLIKKILDQCLSKKGDEQHKGCFSVYVGATRERFVVRTECVNHPLFRQLLEEAEEEHGYTARRPVELLCNVEVFIKVMEEIEQEKATEKAVKCGLVRGTRPTGCWSRAGG